MIGAGFDRVSTRVLPTFLFEIAVLQFMGSFVTESQV